MELSGRTKNGVPIVVNSCSMQRRWYGYGDVCSPVVRTKCKGPKNRTPPKTERWSSIGPGLVAAVGEGDNHARIPQTVSPHNCLDIRLRMWCILGGRMVSIGIE